MEQFHTIMPLLKELYQRLRPHTDWREIEMDFGGRVRASLNLRSVMVEIHSSSSAAANVG